jgi:hypothetical protein
MRYSKGSPKRKIYSHANNKNTELSQINDPMLHLKFLEKQEQANPKKNPKERNNKK